MNRSTPGLPVHHQLPEFTQTHVHWVGDAIQPSHPLSSPSPPGIFPASGSFQVSQLFASGGQSIGVSASASVFPMNTQDWSLGWTGWISLQSKGLSRVSSNITVQKHQFFSTQLSLQSNSHPYMTTRETIALTRWTFVDKVMSLLFKKPEWKVHNTWTLQAKYDNLTKAIFLIEMLDQRPCPCTIWF